MALELLRDVEARLVDAPLDAVQEPHVLEAGAGGPCLGGAETGPALGVHVEDRRRRLDTDPVPCVGGRDG